jgi:hypothetical protein
MHNDSAIEDFDQVIESGPAQRRIDVTVVTMAGGAQARQLPIAFGSR